MGLFQKLLSAFKDQVDSVNAEEPTQVILDGAHATCRGIRTRKTLWTADLSEVLAVSAYVQTSAAMDYVTVRLEFPGQVVEIDDDTGGFASVLRTIEELVGTPVLEEAMALGRPAYAGANAVLWQKPQN
jgi:hypothetical protein